TSPVKLVTFSTTTFPLLICVHLPDKTKRSTAFQFCCLIMSTAWLYVSFVSQTKIPFICPMILANAEATKTRLNNNTAIVFNDFTLGLNNDDTGTPLLRLYNHALS